MAGHETDSPRISEGGVDSKDGSSRFLLEPSSPTSERSTMLGSSTLPVGCPPIAFRPPVHRKHERGHHGKSKGSHKRPPRTAYSDVPLRMLGSQSSIDSPEYHISPTHSFPLTMQRKSDSAIEQQMDSIDFNRSNSCNNKDFEDTVDNNMIVVNGLNEQPSMTNSVVMSGTIKRGKKQDMVNVNLSKDEMDALTRSTLMDKDKSTGSKCGLRMGPHILLLSVLYIPIAFITSLVVSFYTGSMCWYNIYIYFSEEKTFAHKLLICPLLIIFYPFLIVLFSLGIAIYASIVQISWYFSSWFKEIKDFDKNVFGYLCDKLSISQCSPYEVIIIDDNVIKTETKTEDGNLTVENEVEMCMISNQEITAENPEALVMTDVETYCMDEESKQQQQEQLDECTFNVDMGKGQQEHLDMLNNQDINQDTSEYLHQQEEQLCTNVVDNQKLGKDNVDSVDNQINPLAQSTETAPPMEVVLDSAAPVKTPDDHVEFEYDIDSNIFQQEIINDIVMNSIEEEDEEEDGNDDDNSKWFTAQRSFSSGDEKDFEDIVIDCAKYVIKSDEHVQNK